MSSRRVAAPRTGTPKPRPERWSGRVARRQQREFWDAAFAGDPARLGSAQSPFARRVLRTMGAATGRRLIELGCGPGRDTVGFVRRGFAVAAVDVSRVAVRIARRATLLAHRPAGTPRPVVDVADALDFLAMQPTASADVVYSNMFFTMGYPPSVDRRIRREVARVLRPGGLHFYSVRSRDDQWFGRGIRLGPGTFHLAPDGPPVRFFTSEEIRRRGAADFELLELRTGAEGTGRFARRMLYVTERRKAPL